MQHLPCNVSQKPFTAVQSITFKQVVRKIFLALDIKLGSLYQRSPAAMDHCLELTKNPYVKPFLDFLANGENITNAQSRK